MTTARRSPHRGSTSRPGRTRLASRGRSSAAGPIVAFLLIACFGMLFVGCTGIRGPEEGIGELSFTEDDLEKFSESTERVTLTGSNLPLRSGTGQTASSEAVVDLSQSSIFAAIRSEGGASGGASTLYRVSNEFLNVRSEPRNTAAIVVRLDGGALVEVIEFVNAGWAKVKLSDGRTGFVANRYLAKIVSEDRLAEEKKAFEGLYYVSFSFVNVRAQPNQQSDKLGEIPGETFVRPISMDGDWAKVPFAGKEAYVSRAYLSPFMPNFLVRQDSFTLPVFHYQIDQEGTLSVLKDHVLRLQREGIRFITAREFGDLLLAQEERDTRLKPGSVVITLSGVTPENVRAVSDAVASLGARVTVFIETRHVGLSGITEKMLLTLAANGADIESMGHTGDDLRSLTNAQLDLELRQSRRLLEDLLHRPVVAIAYPLGGVNERVTQRTAAAGYLMGLGIVPQKTFGREELLKMPGYAVTSSLTSDDILKIVK